MKTFRLTIAGFLILTLAQLSPIGVYAELNRSTLRTEASLESLPVTAGLEQTLHAAGLEEGSGEHWRRISRQWKTNGWIDAPDAFASPFLLAEELALSNHRKQFLQALALLLDALSQPPLTSPAQVRGRGPTPSGNYSAAIDLPFHGDLLWGSVGLQLGRTPKVLISLAQFQRSTGKMVLLGKARIGADSILDARPSLHLDMVDPDQRKSWRRHCDLTPAWSQSASRPDQLEAFGEFQEKLLAQIEHLPLKRAEPFSVTLFRERYPSQTAHLLSLPTQPSRLLVIPEGILIWIYRPNSLSVEVDAFVRAQQETFSNFSQLVRLRKIPSSADELRRPAVIIADVLKGPLPFEPPSDMPVIPHQPGQPLPSLLQMMSLALFGPDAAAMEILEPWSFEENGRRFIAAAVGSSA